MAIKATVFKAFLQIADMDRHYYADHTLTLARHPSETDERMMLRLLAFALFAHDALAFGKGLSADDEPDLWQRDLTGAVTLWIELGLPDERRLRRAAGRARRVELLAYGSRGALEPWRERNLAPLQRIGQLGLRWVPQEESRALALLCDRNMRLQVTVQEGQAVVTDGDRVVTVEPRALGQH